ncbi:4Fe-4S binding protein [Desulfuromonas sp. AOP6]|uniref:4Fe-4S binding protein n=1 Tax=Desulfuromonas sp. AOP6 TaxID=1566351 RepID=UPI0012802446|nr:4Fe-4S binding protein [Desulfuromonas sp. AOP6]BCA78750.1 (Fe-S)-binding protein [Desulfuromonas sp. AOP6]
MLSAIHLLYFSPTGTTRKIVEEIAAGIPAGEVRHYDLTRLEAGLDLQLTDGLAIIGVPVYAGRVPEVCLKRMEGLSATGVPVVLVALYGNRAFEDALVELRDVAVARGFSVLAAGAFIGEHSYSTPTQPIAPGRPDAPDRQKAREFGALVAEKLQMSTFAAAPPIPGDTPYKERVPLGGVAPTTDKALCTLCGTCAKVCPTMVIRVEDEVTTAAENCVMCCACVKACPVMARSFHHPMIEARRQLLVANFSERREPELFL